MKQLQAIERGEVKWEFPPNKFSTLAQDFFLKLCSYPSSIRYDAERALMHPWITRDLNQEIPLTVNQEIALFDKERKLSQAMKVVFFKSVLVHLEKEKGLIELPEYKKLLMKQN